MNRSKRLSSELPKPKLKSKQPVQPARVETRLAPRPLAPRRGLFIVLSIVFAMWIGYLLYLYFTTVRAHVGF